MEPRDIEREDVVREGGIRAWFRRLVASFRPFILVTTTDGRGWPLDTDKAHELQQRVRRRPDGEDLAGKILHATMMRSWIHPDAAEMEILVDTISTWVSQEGEPAAGKQLLELREVLERDLGRA